MKNLPPKEWLSKSQRRWLAQKIYSLVSEYDDAIDQCLGSQTEHTADHLHLKNGRELAYAENRCQKPAFIYSGGSDNPLAMTKFQVVAGNPSYIAMADGSRLVSTLCLMTEAPSGGRLVYRRTSPLPANTAIPAAQP